MTQTQIDQEKKIPRTIEVSGDRSISISDAAMLLGVTYNSVLGWTKDPDNPLPLANETGGRGGKGGKGRVLLSELVNWRVTREVDKLMGDDDDDDEEEGDEATPEGTKKAKQDYAAARAKRMFHQANSAEIAELRDRRSVLPVDMMLRVVEEETQVFKDRVLDLPGRLSTRVSAITDPKQCYDEIRKECVAALNGIKSAYTMVSDVDELVRIEQASK